MAIPARVADRPSNGIKRFQPVLTAAKSRDVNESVTSMIVTDMMADLFGYDKYSEVTRELCIRGTYYDLATRIDGKFQMIIEVKAIGLELKDAHAKQAVDYASGRYWPIHRKPSRVPTSMAARRGALPIMGISRDASPLFDFLMPRIIR